MAQLDLPFARPVESAFEPRRNEPTFWISNITILREPNADAVVRQISLRRGLNILWARPTQTAQVALNQGGLSGHAAGKTTFCRLIRYLLGESRFAAPRVQERVRSGDLRDGWVVGTVHISGETWTVGRPFALHVHPVAAKGKTFAEALEKGGGFQEFLDALSAACLAGLPAAILPTSGRQVDFPLLLTWLARDQEARFAGVEEWRSPRSESDSPSPPAMDRFTLIRSVLDIVSDEEANLVREWEELDREKDSLDHRATVAQVRADDRRKRLADKLGLPKSVVDSQVMLLAAAAAEVADRRKRAESSRASLAEIQAAAADAENDKDEAMRVHAETMGRLAALKTESTLGPEAMGRCNVPLSVAAENGCKLAFERGAVPPRDNRAEIDALEQKRVAAEADLQRARESFLERRKSLSAAEARVLTTDREWRDAEALLKEMRAADRDENSVEERKKDRTRQMAEVSERRGVLRKSHADALERLSNRFEFVLRALLGDRVKGRVEVTRDGIRPLVIAEGDRESAALDTICVVAFDLCALSLGFEDRAFFPGFLLHDGPREADMDQAVYDRVFLLAEQAERAFPNPDAVGFQYILTTTTPPPESLRRSPWLLDPVLDASVEEGRLFRMNL
ncbi:MAG: hypothetical protein IPK82_35465 [Polyangiaceae bacterium]|nr:hypothetical protein [Polyangiaceae bacterium]